MYRLTKAIVEFIGYEFAIFIALYGSVATDIKIAFSILIDTIDIVTFYATIVNTIVLFMLLFICFAVIWWLIYIAKNLHNIAKFTILYPHQ